MYYEKELVATQLKLWEKYLLNYKLPLWEEIPNFGLYMEQVIALIKQYFDNISPVRKDDEIITSAIVNNYVRKKIIPEPLKKKYYRKHIVYLIMICSMKQSVSIKTLQALIPVDLNEDEIKNKYESYVLRHNISTDFFINQVKDTAEGILNNNSDSTILPDNAEEVITASIIISGFYRMLAEKLLSLDGSTLENKE